MTKICKVICPLLEIFTKEWPLYQIFEKLIDSTSFSVDAVPCKIAFEMGKVRNFWLLALSAGTSGWVLVAEETLRKRSYGIVRVVAPLAGCNVSIDVSILLLLVYNCCWTLYVLKISLKLKEKVLALSLVFCLPVHPVRALIVLL